MDFFGMGMGEILLILIIAIIFLGPGKIVEFAKTLGKWTRAIKKAGNDFTTSVKKEVELAEKAIQPSPANPTPAAQPPAPSAVSKAVPAPPAPETKPAQPPVTSSQPGPQPGPDGERHPG
jgi:Tat protein translocase TatB subunit